MKHLIPLSLLCASALSAQTTKPAPCDSASIVSTTLTAWAASRDTAAQRVVSSLLHCSAPAPASPVVVPVAPPVVAPPASTVTPLVFEDFSEYASTADLNANAKGLYQREDKGGPWGQWNLITLDTTTGVADVGAGTSHRSMRYNWPDRTNATGVQPDAPRCTDFYISKTISLASLTEAWAELYVKFSTTFTTKAPASWSCASNPDYKFIFFGTASSRFSLKNDYAGLATRWDATAPGQGDGDNNFVFPVWHDAQWHRIRMHARLASSGASNGVYQIWLDSTLVMNQQNIATANQAGMTSILLGANMNQGTDHPMTLNWGSVAVWNKDPGWR